MFFGLGCMLGMTTFFGSREIVFPDTMRITGPALGSLMYNIGGFQLPFHVVGTIALFVAMLLLCVIPNVQSEPVKKAGKERSLGFQEIVTV